MRILALLGVACTAQGPPQPTATTADSGTPGLTPGTATCALSENPLRVDCEIALAEPGLATLVLSAEGAPTRTFEAAETQRTHTLTGWGLLPETPYTWSLGDDSGTVTTGPLPAAMKSASIEAEGTPFGFEALLHPLECGDQGYFVLLDPEGRIIWFEPNDVFFRGGMSGYEWSEDSRSVLSVTGQTFLEQHVSGEELLRLQAPGDFREVLHHDTDRWGAYRYLLFEHRVGGVNVDGVHVHDGQQIVGTFHLEDHFAITGGQNDWSHGNGLNLTADGVIILSLRNFDAVVAIDGDPASDTFLDILWHAGGAPDTGLPGADYHAPAGAGQGFVRQHNANRFGNELWVFDNLSLDSSRALRMRMNDSAGTLTVTGSWSFLDRCPNHGGALPVPGGVLATCANTGDVWLFEETASLPSWTLRATCGGALDRVVVPRAIPVRVR